MSAPAATRRSRTRSRSATDSDGESEVVDPTPAAERSLLADDRVGRDLEHVQFGTATHVKTDHSRVVILAGDLEQHLGSEHLAIERDVPVEVGGQDRRVIEATRERHEVQLRTP